MVRLSIAAALMSGIGALAGTFSQITDSGISNPTNVGFYMYVPTNLAANPAIIVAIHYCSGTASAYYTGTTYSTLAEQYGFLVIYPQSPYSGTCWDVSSESTLTHNGGGNSNSIANMVTWTLAKYNGDASKVFVTGTSSGAMMTNVMAATYPEMFAAATVYSGVPAGCFRVYPDTVDGWNSSCSEGLVTNTPAGWASIVDAMYPGYTGARPKMQIYHGSVDTTLYPANYNETIKEWCGVFGYNYQAPTKTENNVPQTNYYRYTFGSELQGIYAIGVGHTVPVQEAEDMKWFGFTSTTGATGTTTTTASSSGSTGSSGSGTVAEWGQCGGIGYSGSTTCASPYTCHVVNSYYSQCY